jgi:hypothetical protein
VFYEAERQNHETGAVVDTPEASGGRVVVGRPGAAAGFLTFGPYRPLPAGAYVARFRVRGSGLRLDVTSNFGERVLAERAVDPGPDWVDEVLPFRVEHARPLELRVAWDGRREAAVDWVLVVAADRPEVERTYEVEALPHRLGERADPAASGGWAAYADPVESLRGDLLGGPARLFPPGRYQLALRLRAAGVGRGPLVRLSVTEPAGRTLFSRVVEAAEAPPGDYREVTLDFTLDRPRVLEFPVAFLGDVGVFFARHGHSSVGSRPGPSARAPAELHELETERRAGSPTCTSTGARPAPRGPTRRRALRVTRRGTRRPRRSPRTPRWRAPDGLGVELLDASS